MAAAHIGELVMNTAKCAGKIAAAVALSYGTAQLVRYVGPDAAEIMRTGGPALPPFVAYTLGCTVMLGAEASARLAYSGIDDIRNAR